MTAAYSCLYIDGFTPYSFLVQDFDHDHDDMHHLIRDLDSIHPELASIVALKEFGVRHEIVYIEKCFTVDWKQVRNIFDKYCSWYSLSYGRLPLPIVKNKESEITFDPSTDYTIYHMIKNKA